MGQRRLTLIMSHFHVGGAERILSSMANYWAEHGWPIHLFVLDGGGKPPFYPLHPAVIWQDLDLSQPLGAPLQAAIRLRERLARLRRAIDETAPDAVISFNDQTNVIVLMAMYGSRVPVIVGERNDPHHKPMENPWRLLRAWLYRRAACVVAQTQHALAYFPEPIRVRGRVIPNPVAEPPSACESPGDGQPRQPGGIVLAMGRLDRTKGFDRLIRAFASIAHRHPDWRVDIWGEGAERANLEQLIDAQGLAGRVRLPGMTRATYEKMRQSDLFVLSSQYEGFPNVLCEAMACGLPVVSFNCESGPSEIIRDGLDGILVPPGDIDALAGALDRLLSCESERHRLALRAPEVVERFNIDKIMRQWSCLVRELGGGAGQNAKYLHGQSGASV